MCITKALLTNKEENNQEIVTRVSDIAPTFVSDLNTIDEVLDLITILGSVLNCKEKAQEINDKISYKKTEFTKLIKDKSNKKVAYFIWQNPFMVAGDNTFINELLKINNFKNVFDDLERYPEISLENLPDLDYIFLSSEPYPFQEKHKEFFTKYTKAKVTLVDGEYFSWYGSRLIKAFDYFSNLQAKLDIL